MSDQPRPTAIIEELLDAAFRELQHDTGPQDEEYVHQRGVLTKKFRRILREYRKEEREPAARAERVAELDGKLLKLHEVYGEHLYFLRAPSMQDGFRIAAEKIKELRAENAKLREALAPSSETKAAYIGEFSFEIEDCDEDGEPCARKVEVPWTTIKEIMAAISRQALAGKEEG